MKFPKQTHTKAMEGSDKRRATSWYPALREKKMGSLAHLPRGFVGKGECENVPWMDPLRDEPCDAVRDGLGLSRAGARDNEERPLSVHGRFALFFV